MGNVQNEGTSPIILAENLTKIYMAGRIEVTAVSGVLLAGRAHKSYQRASGD